MDLKRRCSHPCATISDGVHANAFSLAATAKISGVNNVFQNPYGDLRASGDLDYTILCHTSFVFLHFENKSPSIFICAGEGCDSVSPRSSRKRFIDDKTSPDFRSVWGGE